MSEETQRDAINKIKNEAIGVGIENILKEAQIGKTRTETNAIINEVKQKWEQIKQGWKNLDIAEKQRENLKNTLMEEIEKINTSNQSLNYQIEEIFIKPKRSDIYNIKLELLWIEQ